MMGAIERTSDAEMDGPDDLFPSGSDNRYNSYHPRSFPPIPPTPTAVEPPHLISPRFSYDSLPSHQFPQSLPAISSFRVYQSQIPRYSFDAESSFREDPSKRPIHQPEWDHHPEPFWPGSPGNSITEHRDPTSHSGRGIPMRRRADGKTNTPSACAPCKRAHLACDEERPCRRCHAIGKQELCIDLPHKKRGRPKTATKIGKQASPPRRNRPISGSFGSSNAIGLEQLLIDDDSSHRRPVSIETRHGRSLTWSGNHPLGSCSEDAVLEAPLGNGLTDSSASHQEDAIYFFCNLALTILQITTRSQDSQRSQDLQERDWSGMIDGCLMDFVHPQDADTFLEARSRALVPEQRTHTSERRFGSLSSKDLNGYSSSDLLLEAPGFHESYSSRRIRFPDCSSAAYDVRFRIGGCLGANGLEPKTLDKGYFIISLTGGSDDPSGASTSSETPAATPSSIGSGQSLLFGGNNHTLPPLSSIFAGLPDAEERHRWSAQSSPSYEASNPLSPRHDPFLRLPQGDGLLERRRKTQLPTLLMSSRSFDESTHRQMMPPWKSSPLTMPSSLPADIRPPLPGAYHR